MAVMPEQTMARCELCGVEVPAVPRESSEVRDRFPAYSGGPAFRFFESGAYALLHHECRSMQANTNWQDGERYVNRGRDWWACQEPHRPLDAETAFDVNCMACASRWEAEKGERRA